MYFGRINFFTYLCNQIDIIIYLSINNQSMNKNQNAKRLDRRTNSMKPGRWIALTAGLVFCLTSATAQTKVTGKITDQMGEPIIGGSVMEKGTNNGAITDLDGNFTLTTKKKDAVLVFSYVGYKTQELSASDKMKITLKEASELLEDVVVVGYGVQKKSSVTGAISQVKSEDMEHRTLSNAQSALQGKTAGVQVIGANSPGKSPTIRVRGVSSNGTCEPLYVVDGIRLSNIANLDPNTIESMEVLKDAASAAIYGAEAGNGVVLITTKKGKTGNARISYEFQWASQSVCNKPRLLNAEEYINYMSESGVKTREALEANWVKGTSTDWIDATFEDSKLMKHNLSVSGGNEKGAYFVSLSHMKDDGVIKGDADRYNRLAGTINANYRMRPWLNVGTTNNIDRFERGEVETGEFGTGLIFGALNMDPLTPVTYGSTLPSHVQKLLDSGKKLSKDSNGNYYGVSDIVTGDAINPLINRDRKVVDVDGFRVSGSVFADINLVKGLVFTSRFGYGLSSSSYHAAEHPYYANTERNLDYAQAVSLCENSIYYQWENFANFTHTFADAHTLTAMAGMSFQKNEHDETGVTLQPNGEDAVRKDADGFFYPNYASSTSTRMVRGEKVKTAKYSYFGRIGYDYKGRYMLQASLRADAADLSMLPKNNRWGYFPAVSAGWTISQEKFWEPLQNAIQSLKFRASWGQNGSLASLGNYLYSTTIVTNGGYNYITGTNPSTVGNPDLKWETSDQIDLGLDGRAFGGRMNFGIDYYVKKTKDLLVGGTRPTFTLGGKMPVVNAGDVENKGWEFELGWRDHIGKDFQYSIRGNLATLHNEVTFLDPSLSRIQGATAVGYYKYPTYFEKGHAAYYFRGYKFEGVDPATGDPIFADLDNSGTAGDDGDMTDLGNALPKFTYGITLTAAWKGIDLLVFGSGSYGNHNYLQMTSKEAALNNRLKEVFYDGRWTTAGSEAEKPRAGMNNMDKYLLSSAMVYDASYFKIKQIQLGYTVPKTLLRKTRFIENLRLYCSLEDFFTFTSYPGLDPEISPLTYCAMGVDKGSYPSSKKVVLGFNIDF